MIHWAKHLSGNWARLQNWIRASKGACSSCCCHYLFYLNRKRWKSNILRFPGERLDRLMNREGWKAFPLSTWCKEMAWWDLCPITGSATLTLINPFSLRDFEKRGYNLDANCIYGKKECAFVRDYCSTFYKTAGWKQICTVRLANIFLYNVNSSLMISKYTDGQM